ncbi:integrase catalytic domain-containing protein [Trichonephila inaurata madagascariensis]|uniref:Integrase catalytic domain-containing protein n=1 Tax=Trichonephila inaurata madagascariensis TaxID=2747483 RepID=A0A8X7CE07_9ARAC|nr:integrase catalytic domain-containing protein [Trichonephila inaurata madagascariensis]
MDALKLRRTPLRTAFMKAVNHLQEIIENDPVDMNAVETAFQQLKKKSAKLKEVEDAALELMIESNCTQEAYNIEFEAIEGYSEKMIAWQVNVKNIMKTDALGQKTNHSLVTSLSSSLRLPKIQFQQFSGELTDWLPHFNLRGWQSNVLLNPEKFSELESQLDNFETMVLGLIWNLKDDCLSCNINCQKNEGIKIPRCLNLSSNGIKQITLHVFCDAIKKAYAACVFLRVEYEENVFVKLIQAKARVAPLKDISIPRLELLSCTLGTRLAASFKNDLNLPDVHIYYLTDSMTALAWIQHTRDWGVFVFNRVKEIRNLSDVSSLPFSPMFLI